MNTVIFENIQINENIHLEPISLEHTEALAACMNNKKVTKNVFFTYPWSFEYTQNCIKSSSPIFKEKNCRLFMAIMMKKSTSEYEFKGWVSFIYYEAHKHYRIGYALDESIWGRGIGSLCCRKGCEYWFQDKFGIDTIETYAYPENAASQRILEKCGFKKSGKTIMAKRLKWDSQANDFCESFEEFECDIMAVTKEDFAAIE